MRKKKMESLNFLNWLLAKSWILPISGTTKLNRLEENIVETQLKFFERVENN